MTGIFKKATPFQLLVIGYAGIVLIIAMLLKLPVSSSKGISQPFIDAIFIATSGVSTSGLTVVDIGSYYSTFGQIILLIDFQIGGIGYMTIFAFIAYLFNRKISLTGAMVAVESLAGPKLGDFKIFFKRTLLYTLVFEGFGAAALTIYWMPQFSFLTAVYFGVFHSVSTFCTAGFALFPDSLMRYEGDVFMNLLIDVLSLVGGISFFVLNDLYDLGRKKIRGTFPRRLSEHTKLALVVTLIINLLGTVVILLSEQWPSTAHWGKRVLISSFEAISASTTDGFNSVDIGSMNVTSLFMLILLMFVGASPGSTGGGIKTTTVGIMAGTLWSVMKGKHEVNVFQRRISDGTAIKAFTIFLFFVFVTIINILIMNKSEKASFLQILFEIVSALGNTGLSTGITSSLSTVGKVLLTITMFIGRVGSLTIGFALIGASKSNSVKYAQGEIFVG
jgi:trk system potassium uptake protein